MSKIKHIRQPLAWLLTIGATVSLGFLSFAGMFVITPSLLLCSAAFTLAVAYEGQINLNNISRALLRMFDKNHLKDAIISRHLDESLEKNRDNLFMKEYQQWKNHLDEISTIDHPTPEQLENKQKVEERLIAMRLLIIKQLKASEEPQTELEKNARRLLENDKNRLVTEINTKKWLIRLGWLFAIGGGVSSGFATYSATVAGVSSFALLSATPASILIALSVFAAAGYTLLLYHNVSSMVQDFSGKWKEYFSRDKGKESLLRYALRCTGIVAAVTLGIFATIATAGTWWYATKNGATLLNIGNRSADVIRTVSVSLMALPTLIYNAKNSIASVYAICKADLLQSLKNVGNAVKETWHKESTVSFLNPFRLLSKIVDYTSDTVFFIGHLISIGLVSDRLEGVSPKVCATLTTASEGLTDWSQVYQPESSHCHAHEHDSHDEDESEEHLNHEKEHQHKHEHNHNSGLLSIILLPVSATIFTLNCASVLWDWPFSGNFTKSKNKIFGNPEHPEPCKDMPTLSDRWKKQDVIETCDNITHRLEKACPEKAKAATVIKDLVTSDQKEYLKIHRAALTDAFTENRSSFWKVKTPQSKQDIDFALDNLVGPAI